MPVRWKPTARTARTAVTVPRDRVRVRHSPITFREAALAYLESRRAERGGLSRRTEYLVQQLVDAWGEYLVAEMDDAIVVAWVDEYQRKRGAGTATRNKFLTQMRAILNWAHERGWKADPSKVRVGRPTFRDRHLEMDEIPLFLDWIAEHHPRLLLGMLIFVDAGPRRGEAKRLVWRDVAFEWPEETRGHLSAWDVEPIGGALKIRAPEKKDVAGASKTVSRQVPLSRRLLSQLIVERAARRPKPGDALVMVPHKKGGRSERPYRELIEPQDHYRDAVREFCGEFGIEPHLTLHDLRHTFAYQCGARGIDLGDLQLLMGHRDLSMTMRYRGYCKSRATEVIASF